MEENKIFYIVKKDKMTKALHQQKFFFASRASCASDACEAHDVNCDSRGNAGRVLPSDAT